jgi:hypothetical protein
MTIEERIHELKMTALNLRPKPRISTRCGAFGYGNGMHFWIAKTLSEAIKIAVNDRTSLSHWKD